jgi:type IX secretion system PorP/SprF family membrane protein
MKLIYTLIIAMMSLHVMAQDPHFTQFYYAPFSVNPAYAGVFDGQARVVANYRNQWGNISPFSTAAVSADMKLGIQDENMSNPFNVGVQLMNDRSMKGAFQSNYATLAASYFVKLDYEGRNSLGAGFSGSYGSRRIDFSGLSFDQQLTTNGFDRSIPTGESALQALKPFASLGAGLLFRHENSDMGEFMDVGVSAFHFNKPRQSVLDDKNQFVPLRISCQFSYQKYLDDFLMLNLRGLYQSQASVTYYQAGLSLAKLINESNDLVGAGLWYRTGDAVSPYVFMEYRKLLIGFSYDVAVNDLKKGSRPAKSLELSLQWRMDRE